MRNFHILLDAQLNFQDVSKSRVRESFPAAPRANPVWAELGTDSSFIEVPSMSARGQQLPAAPRLDQ